MQRQAWIYLLRISTIPFSNLEMRLFFRIFRLIFFSLFKLQKCITNRLSICIHVIYSYRTRAIITRSRFETALDYKPRIFKVKKVSLYYKPLCNINRGLYNYQKLKYSNSMLPKKFFPFRSICSIYSTFLLCA